MKDIDLARYPVHRERIPEGTQRAGKYEIRFARTREELDRILQLRFHIFNLELGEGLEESVETQRDEDEFDVACHHLMVIRQDSQEIVGTYRMQTREMARSQNGFYASSEFDLSAFGDEVLDHAIEIGRACIAKNHRNGRVLFLLFKGLAWYVQHNNKKHFFGCCSLTSQDPEEGLVMEKHLKEFGYMHPDILIPLQAGYECGLPEMTLRTFPEVKIPRLMKIYLNYGAKICSPPAMDRLFKTIDFMTLISLADIDEKTLNMFID